MNRIDSRLPFLDLMLAGVLLGLCCLCDFGCSAIRYTHDPEEMLNTRFRSMMRCRVGAESLEIKEVGERISDLFKADPRIAGCIAGTERTAVAVTEEGSKRTVHVLSVELLVEPAQGVSVTEEALKELLRESLGKLGYRVSTMWRPVQYAGLWGLGAWAE